MHLMPICGASQPLANCCEKGRTEKQLCSMLRGSASAATTSEKGGWSTPESWCGVVRLSATAAAAAAAANARFGTDEQPQIYALCKACMEEDQQRHCTDVKISVP